VGEGRKIRNRGSGDCVGGAGVGEGGGGERKRQGGKEGCEEGIGKEQKGGRGRGK